MKIIVTLSALLLADLLLLLTGKRVLLYEKLVRPGEHYVVEGWGELGAAQQSQLACYYFTGRSVRVTVLWYSADNILGRNECPFVASV